MKKDEIHLFDIKRILFGEAPPSFLLEVLIRTLIVYIALLLVVKLMGKRMNGQISIVEFAIMLTLGAIISVPMQIPDKGILPGLFLLSCALGFERGINLWSVKKRRVEGLVQGNVSLLVKDGVLQLEEMGKTRISHQQLFSTLRNKNIYELGKVKRVYLEACGVFSVYQEQENKPGLPILPPDEHSLFQSMKQQNDQWACCNCGYVIKEQEKNDPCPHCAEKNWTKAVI